MSGRKIAQSAKAKATAIWARLVGATPTAATRHLPPSHGTGCFTDATGATIVVNKDGRFRLDRMSGEYVRDE